MKNKVHRIFILLSVMLLISCTETLEIQLPPEVKVFMSNGNQQGIHLTATDKEYVALNEWLREHSSDWHFTSGRYPGGVYIKTGQYGIQVTQTHVILYSTTSPEPKAVYIQKISKSELAEIKNMGQ